MWPVHRENTKIHTLLQTEHMITTTYISYKKKKKKTYGPSYGYKNNVDILRYRKTGRFAKEEEGIKRFVNSAIELRISVTDTHTGAIS